MLDRSPTGDHGLGRRRMVRRTGPAACAGSGRCPRRRRPVDPELVELLVEQVVGTPSRKRSTARTTTTRSSSPPMSGMSSGMRSRPREVAGRAAEQCLADGRHPLVERRARTRAARRAGRGWRRAGTRERERPTEHPARRREGPHFARCRAIVMPASTPGSALHPSARGGGVYQRARRPSAHRARLDIEHPFGMMLRQGGRE